MKPLWKGPIEDGITQSLLNRFLECRERFRLLVVEGLKDEEGFDHKLEFGTMFHLLLEHQDQGSVKLREYQQKYLYKKYPDNKKEIDKWCRISVSLYDIYKDYWNKDTEARKIRVVAPEQSFRVPYTLPSGRKITLRGKIDAIVQSGKSYYLQENKCKGWIDQEGIASTLQENMQAMFYYIACQEMIQSEASPIANTLKPIQQSKISGIYFNVIRRPLSEKYSIIQKKGRLIKPKKPGEKPKRVGTETDKEFLERLTSLIRENPQDFFYRWKHNIRKQGLERFKQECFHPILEQLLDWWEWIEHCCEDDISPFSSNHWEEYIGVGDEIYPMGYYPICHYRTPWGIWNSLAGGFRGSYFEYLTKGSDKHLIQTDNLFPELSLL